MNVPSESSSWTRVASGFLGTADEIRILRTATGGFSEAVVVQLSCGSEHFALRGWPRCHWPLARVRERHRWLQHLAVAGIPVAVPLREQQTLDTVVSVGEFDWQLEPWLPGEAPPAGAEKGVVERPGGRWQCLSPHPASGHLLPPGEKERTPLPPGEKERTPLPPGEKERTPLPQGKRESMPLPPAGGQMSGGMNPDRWRSLMHMLARLHLASAAYICTPVGREWFSVGRGPSPSVQQRRKIIAGWTPAKLMEVHDQLGRSSSRFASLAIPVLSGFLRHAGKIDEELAAVEQVAVPVFPCLRDLWREHVLFTGNEVTGIIDPTAARTDHVATDISRLLGSLLVDDRASWGNALQEYETIRPLTDVEHRLIRIFDRSSVLLSGMTWVERWSAGTIPAEQLDDVAERMEIIAGRMNWL